MILHYLSVMDNGAKLNLSLAIMHLQASSVLKIGAWSSRIIGEVPYGTRLDKSNVGALDATTWNSSIVIRVTLDQLIPKDRKGRLVEGARVLRSRLPGGAESRGQVLHFAFGESKVVS
jgi:hypothetical protein